MTNLFKDWVVKARTYVLAGDASPPLRQIRTRHQYDNHLMVFDEGKKVNRELRYASNQKSPFVDEQADKDVRVEHIFFKDGMLFTNREDIAMQQFLSVTPDNGIIFLELKPESEAEEQVEDFEVRAIAYDIVKNASLDTIAAYMYTEIDDAVFLTTSKELKRDLYVVADGAPEHLIAMADDKSTELKYIARKAVKFDILTIADNGRTIKWTKNGRKVLAVSMEETPYSALAAYFLTDDGIATKAKVIELLKDFE